MFKQELIKAFETKEELSLKEIYSLFPEHKHENIRGTLNAYPEIFLRVCKGKYKLASIEVKQQ